MKKLRTCVPLGSVALALAFVVSAGCGDINIRNGDEASYSDCQDIGGQFHFKVLVPPWKYNKEYRCSQWAAGQCVGVWSPTGRYVFVVSDAPFVNYDSEIIASLDVERTSGNTASLVYNLIASEGIGQPGSNATYHDGTADDYPREILGGDGALSGHEILWRQERSFQGATFNWYRRDSFLSSPSGYVFHLKFFSIEEMNKPEFDILMSSFREGPTEDGTAPDCPCRDEHDPAGPTDC
ncbi:MAG: hypothetical protein ABI333_26130 [bacterium]